LRKTAIVVGVLSSAFISAGRCHALGLRTSAAEIFLGDVRPGKVAVELSVENTGAEKAIVEVAIETPPPSRLKDGYEPLPDMRKAVVVKGPSRPLEPAEKSALDIVAAIPRSLAGGQYQFDCLLKGRNAGGSELTMRTAVTLSVGEGVSPDISREPGASGFSVSPAKAHLADIPLGKRTAARSNTFRALKTVNAGETELVVRARTVRAWDESVTIEEGYEPAPNPHWLQSGPALRVEPGQVSEMTFTLEIPRQQRYRGRKWAFVVAVDAEGGGRVSRTWWTLYVRTQDEEKSRAE
jgi:hypothetical protein